MRFLGLLAVAAACVAAFQLFPAQAADKPASEFSQKSLEGNWNGTWTGTGTLKTGDPVQFWVDAMGNVTGTATLNKVGKVKLTGQLTLAEAKSGKITGRLVFDTSAFEIVDMSVSASAASSRIFRIAGTTKLNFTLDVTGGGGFKTR